VNLGSVEARQLPLAREIVRTKCWSVLYRLGEMALGESARGAADGQSVPGLAQARVAGAREWGDRVIGSFEKRK